MRFIPIVLAAILIPPSLDSAQEREAQNLLKKMEERLLAAKTIQARVSIKEVQKVPDKPDLRREADIHVWVDGEKIRVRMEESHSQEKATAKGKRETVSDGKEMRFLWLEFLGFEEERWLSQKTPPEWRGSVLRGFATFDAESGFTFIQPVGKADKSVWTNSLPVLTDLKSTGSVKFEDSEAHRIEFSATEKKGTGETVDYKGTLWVDTLTNLPLRREKRYEWKRPPHGPREFTVNEYFRKLELDKEVAPKTFELPK